MAGHSQFKNIMFRKGAQDARRAKVFTKIIRELTVAAKSGLPDPDTNPRLRAAMIAAREANMSRDTMERAIKRGAGETGGQNFENVRYEGYGPGGVAMIVDTLTDNRNRTASVVRSAFSKFGGSLGETNSVSFMFDRLGVIRYPAEVASADAMLEAAIEVGANDAKSTDTSHEVECAPDQFHAILGALEKKFGAPASAEVIWRPQSQVTVKNQETAATLMKLMQALEDDDDVQTVSSNVEIPEEVMGRLNA